MMVVGVGVPRVRVGVHERGHGGEELLGEDVVQWVVQAMCVMPSIKDSRAKTQIL